MAAGTSTPYDQAKALFGANIENWIDEYNAMRLASYKIYEDVYWNHPDAFKLVMRGSNEHPIYVPTGKIIVNTMNRYVARGFAPAIDPMFGQKAAQDEMMAAFASLFRRERFKSRFNSNKLYGIMRGDAAWLISANPNKPEGSRISLETIDPGIVFPIEDETDPDQILGVDLIEQVVGFDGKLYVKRQRYLKTIHPEHPNYTETPDGVPTNWDGEICYQVDTYELDGWDDPTKQKRYTAGENLPPTVIAGITKLPVYTWKNFDEPGNPWGASELRGIETLIAGVNQAASDQDLALAIAGLGLYVTDAGAPVDEDGNETTWGLGPGEVVETAVGRKFERVSGVTTVDPSLNHINYLQDQAFRTSGASDVAQGRVDVKVAESGIALQLRMGPILDEASVKDDLIQDCMNQLFYDLRQWFDVYEGTNFAEDTSPVIISKMGDKLPMDKEARRKALMDGYNAIPAIFSGAYVRNELRNMGWNIPDDATMESEIAAEAEFFTNATTGVEGADFGNRLQAEAGDGA